MMVLEVVDIIIVLEVANNDDTRGGGYNDGTRGGGYNDGTRGGGYNVWKISRKSIIADGSADYSII